MAAPDDNDLARWIETRLATVDPPAEWSPNETRGLARFRLRRRGPRGNRRHAWMWIAIAVGAIALIIIPTPTLRAFAHACGELVRRGVPGGHSIDSYAPAGGRRMLPDEHWRDLRGERVRLSAYRGKVVVVTYW